MIDMIRSKWRGLSPQGQATFSASAFFFTIVILCCFIYSPFIFGDHLLIFSGSGSDSIGQTIPFILNEASRLFDGDLSQWNKYQFLGATTIQHLNPDYLPAILGEQAVPIMMLVSQLAKIILAGIFFYLFLGYYNLLYKTRYIAGLGYAFCGRMIELAPWTAYTIEVTLLALMLWGFERFFANRKKVAIMPLGLGLMGMSEGLYALVLYCVVLVGYAIFRAFYTTDTFKDKKAAFIFALQFTALLLAGILISLPVILPSLEMYSTSSRISSDMGNSGFSLLSILLPSSTTVCSEEVIKFFSNAILGHMNSFSGSTSILNSPYYYSGLLPLLGIAFAFKGKSRRQKIALAAILFVCLFYCYSNGFRYILNGFSVSGDDFRQSSFWVTAVVCLAGSIGLDGMWGKSKAKQICLWTVLILIAFIVAALSIWNEISTLYFAVSVFFILLYTSLLLLSSRARANKQIVAEIAISLIVLAAPIEYIVQDCKAVQNTTHLTWEDYNEQLGSNPKDLIALLGENDTSTQRIDYKTMMLTRSMASTYLGTQAYIGGSGLTQSITDFVKSLDNDYIDQLGYSRYSYGFSSLATNTLLGVKYLVYPNDGTSYYIPYGYQEIGSDDNYTVLANTNSLPLVFAYKESETISTEAYLSTQRENRSNAMLNAVVLPDGNNQVYTPEEPTKEIASTSSTATPTSPVSLSIPNSNCEWLEISANLHAEASVSGSVTAKITLFDNEGNTSAVVPFYTAAGNESLKVQVRNDNFTKATVEIVATNACDNPKIDGISFSACGSDYFAEYNQSCSTRISNSATVNTYENGYIDASIQAMDNGYLATTIPWSNNWILRIDGEQVETFPVNIGFVGCRVSKGAHSVELIYDSSMQQAGLAISVITLLSLLVITPIATRRDNQEDA